MKKVLRKIIIFCASFFFKILNTVPGGKIFLDQMSKDNMSSAIKINHNNHTFVFSTPNILNHFRAITFSSKEPETLDWIDKIPNGEVLWDIGANVGLYSIYAAKTKKCIVYSFEPSVFNLEILSRNIYLNQLQNDITIIPLPLSENLKKNSLNMSNTEWGGALSTFGENYGHDGKKIFKKFQFSTIGISIDETVKLLKIPIPKYLKIDVDGIEQLILKGAKKNLLQIKSILIEVNDDFIEQRDTINKILKNAGFKLREKKHSEMFEGNKSFGNVYNQIWDRT